MRRAGLALLFVAGFALAGGLSSGVLADTTTTTTTSTETSTTTTTTTEPTTTVAPPASQVLPAGVRIQGVPVGGLTPTAAFLALQTALQQPLYLVVGSTRLAPTPAQLGAVAYIWGAITHAKQASPGERVDVLVTVKGETLRAYVAGLAQRYDRTPVDSALRLQNLKPFVTKEQPGLRLQQGAAAAAIVQALKAGSSGPLTLPVKTPQPAVTRASFGPVIVIRRGDNKLQLFHGMRPWRTFTVATGQRIYPTPLGRFKIVVMWKNPWWYPPASPWAKGEKPVPPGPGNPLGTRWMGISAPGVGIHGTPDAASLGYSASHGCIRMAIPSAEWLFDHVTLGTPVYIVAA